MTEQLNEDQEQWEIPPSDRFVSDSESPLALLSSPKAMPSPAISPSPSYRMSSIMIKFLSRTTTTADSITSEEEDSGEEETEEEDEVKGEAEEYYAVMLNNNNNIARNDSISCIQPQEVSIKEDSNVVTSISSAVSITSSLSSSSESSQQRQFSSTKETLKVQVDGKEQDTCILVPLNKYYSNSSGTSTPSQPPEPVKSRKRKNDSQQENNKKYKKTAKRTVTSYDATTTQYLKSVFFEVYSKKPKLTKQQRLQVQEKTGLPSRNITYWFSNHKRRFQDALKVYRKIAVDNQLKNYQEFIAFRTKQGQPTHIAQSEVDEFLALK